MVQNTDRATFNTLKQLGLIYQLFTGAASDPHRTADQHRTGTKRQGVFTPPECVTAWGCEVPFSAYATGINWGFYSPNDRRDRR